jgi:hypothetical protein
MSNAADIHTRAGNFGTDIIYRLLTNIRNVVSSRQKKKKNIGPDDILDHRINSRALDFHNIHK